MSRQIIPFVWSDNWDVEDNCAWFVDGEKNMLFYVDFKTKRCEFIAELPDGTMNKFRLNPRCIKCDEEIFCMPDIGECIWIYQLETSQFKKIEIDNPNKVRIAITNFVKIGEKLFAVSKGLKQILRIDIKRKIIEKYYNLGSFLDGEIAGSVIVGSELYCVSATTSYIFKINLDTNKSEKYMLPNIRNKLHTICFDGEDFWLSGYCKELYVWNEKKNTIRIVRNFPIEFDLNYCVEEKMLNTDIVEYNTPLFLYSVPMRNYIWFFPFRTGEIIYVDKKTYKIYTFEIGKSDIYSKRPTKYLYLGIRYLFQYVRDERYIGLFSFENNCICEIDTVERKGSLECYSFHPKCSYALQSTYNIYQDILCEHNTIDRIIFKSMILGADVERNSNLFKDIGKEIEKKMLEN